MSTPFGPTGKFPHGKFSATDLGELQLGVANGKGKVFVNFGVPVKSIGLEPQGAADLATALIKHAREAARTAGVAISINV